MAASVSFPSGLDRATTRKTGIPSRRTNPIALGIVHGFSGWLDRVAAGGGPERSIPNRRRFEIREPKTAPFVTAGSFATSALRSAGLTGSLVMYRAVIRAAPSFLLSR